MMRALSVGAMLLVAVVAVGCRDKAADAPPTPTAPTTAPKPGWEYTPEDFSVGRKSTANAWCNRQIDKLREEIRTCFNAHAPAECEALQQAGSKKIGSYIRSPRCAK